MDNGYQVGYLDDGEFVEVGRFNNLDAVANSDLEIRHADSETRVVLGDEGFDFDGSDVAGVDALDVQSASVPQVTSNVDLNNNDLSGVDQLTTSSASVNTVTSNVDFDSNDATGISALEAESANLVETTTETLEVGAATINNQPAENPEKLVGFINDSDGSSPLNGTIDGIDGRATDKYYRIEVITFRDNSGVSGTVLKLTLSGLNDGDYDYEMVDETCTSSKSVTGADEYALIEGLSEDQNDSHSAEFRFTPGGDAFFRPGLGLQSASTMVRGSGNYLFTKTDGISCDENESFTFSTTENAKAKIAVFEVQDRGLI